MVDLANQRTTEPIGLVASLDLANQRTTQSLSRSSQSENYTEPIGLVSLW